MILKGKYWLKIDNLEMYALPFFETEVAVDYSVTLNGVTYNLPIMRFDSWDSDWQVSYYNTSGSYFPDGSSSVIAGYCNPPVEIIDYHSQEARLIDFGDEPQTVTMDTDTEQVFNLLFIPLSEDEFVSESNLVQVTNKIIDKIYQEAVAKIEKCKPTLTTVLNNTSGATSLSASINDYDLLFLRATTYTGSSYTPLCYVIPAKMMFSSFGVGSSGNFLVQVADNSKYTNFKATASGLTRSAGSSSSYPGKIYQVYGLKFPTEVN
jgi:hypothetical protein